MLFSRNRNAPHDPGTRQHRRADRREALLAAVALDHRAGDTIQDLGVMRRADEQHVGRADATDAEWRAQRGRSLACRRDHDFLERRVGAERGTGRTATAPARWRWPAIAGDSKTGVASAAGESTRVGMPEPGNWGAPIIQHRGSGKRPERVC